MKTLLFTFSVLSGFYLQAQLAIYNDFYSYGPDTAGAKILHDDNGRYYVLGSFSGTVDLDPSPEEALFTFQGNQDLFLAAYEADGSYIWGHSFGGVEYEFVYDMTLSPDGSLYVTARIAGNTQWGNETLTPIGTSGIAVVKINPAGEVDWGFVLGGPEFNAVTDSEVTDDGNLMLWGYFSAEVDFDPGPGETILTGESYTFGQGDPFLASYSPEGELNFVKTMTGTASREPNAMAKLSDGSFMLSGSFSEDIDVNPDDAVDQILSATGSTDTFLIQVDAQGNLLWSGHLQGAPQEEGDLPRCLVHSITSSNTGEVYITGEFDSTVDFDPGTGTFEFTEANPATDFFPGDVFILKLDSDLNFAWMRYINAFIEDSETAVDNTGNLLMAGVFHGIDVDINTDDDGEFLVSSGPFEFSDYGTFMLSMSPTGEFIEGGYIGGTELRTAINSLSISTFGNVVATGSFSLTADFDPSEDVAEFTSEEGIANFNGFVLTLLGEGLSVTSQSAATDAFVYPNPARDWFSIESALEVELFNLSGETVKSWQQPQPKYHIRELAPGSYIVSWRSLEGRRSQIMIKK